MSDREPPVRLCCFQRHWGAVCPDGKVMCQLCFNRFDKEDLKILENGFKEDVCKPCAEQDKILYEKIMAERLNKVE